MNQSTPGILLIFLLLSAYPLTKPCIAGQSESVFVPSSEITINIGISGARIAAGRHSGKIYSITADNRDNYVITTGEDRTVRIWDISEGRQERMFDIAKTLKFNAVPYKAAFVLERDAIVVAVHSNGLSNNAILIYIHGGMQAGKMFHNDQITTLKTFPDKQHVFSADRSGGIALWKVNINVPLAAVELDKVFGVETPDDGMFGLSPQKALKPDAITQADIVPVPFGVLLATLDGNGELELFDPTEQKRFKNVWITVPVGSRFDSSARSIVVVEPGGHVRLFDLELKELDTLPSDLPPMSSARLSSDGRYLILQKKEDGKVILLSGTDGPFECVALPEQNESFAISYGFSSPDSLFVETPQGLVSWHISQKKVSKPLRYKQFPISNVGIADDQIVFSTKGTDGERGYSFDYRTMTVKAASIIFTMTPEPSYHDLTIVPCTTLKADLCVKQPERDEVRAGYHSNNYSAISLNRDGLLLGGTSNGTFMAESLGQVDIAEIQGAHDSAITRIAVSDDTMVTAGDDNTVKVWDIAPLRKCFSKFHEKLILDTPQEGSPAAVAGLAEGDILEAVNGKKFRDQIEFLDFVKSKGKYSFSIWRKGKPLTITVDKTGPTMGMPFATARFGYSCKNSIVPVSSVFIDDDGAWTAWRQGKTAK